MHLPSRIAAAKLAQAVFMIQFALASAAAPACSDDVALTTATISAGSSSSGASSGVSSSGASSSASSTSVTTGPTTGGGSGSGGGTVGVLPDPDPCDDIVPCSEPKDCCVNPDHPGSNCPDGPFPDNWTCVNSICTHGGCSVDSDCTLLHLPELECLLVDVSTVKQCVATCASDADCVAKHMPGSVCMGDSPKFCREQVSP